MGIQGRDMHGTWSMVEYILRLEDGNSREVKCLSVTATVGARETASVTGAGTVRVTVTETLIQ